MDPFDEDAGEVIRNHSPADTICKCLAIAAAIFLDPRICVEPKYRWPDDAIRGFIHRILVNSASLKCLLDGGNPFGRPYGNGRFYPSAFGIPRLIEWTEAPSFRYYLCLSYSSKDRAIVHRIAKKLEEKYPGKIYLDLFDDNDGIGENLPENLYGVYADESLFCVAFFSNSYLERAWTRHELKAVRARMVQNRGEPYLLPIVIGKVELPSDLKTTRSLKYRRGKESEIVDAVLEKVDAWVDENSISVYEENKRRHDANIRNWTLRAFEEAIAKTGDEKMADLLALVALGTIAPRDKLVPSASAILDLIFRDTKAVTEHCAMGKRISVFADANVEISASPERLFTMNGSGWNKYFDQQAR